MKIKDFEEQIQIGDKVKILYGHSSDNKREEGSIVYKFKGYQSCRKCKNWRGCLGEIILEGNRYTDFLCLRNRKKDNIRLKIISPRFFLPEDELFNI